MKRRTFLATGAGAGLFSTGGCLNRFGIGGDAEESGDDHEDHEEEEDGSAADRDDHDERANDEHGDDSTGATDEADDRDEDGDGDEQEDDEESEGEGEEEEQEDLEDELAPDREDVEPDRDEYERHEEREYEERPASDVEVTAEAHDDGTVVTVQGSVENVSDESIDAVDLYISFHGPGNEYLGATFESVQELSPGESEAFESSTEAGDIVGEIDHIEVDMTVYEFDED